MSKFNVVVITECGQRALLSMRDKTTFSKRVAQREAKEYNLKNNRPARVIPDDQPIHELDDFVTAYLEAALWSSTDDDGEPLDEGRDVDDITHATIEQAIADCADFRAANRALLNRAYKLYAKSTRNAWTPAALAGHDFWLTRNGHGAGFWDRGFGDVGDKLSDAAQVYGAVDLYINDDGKVEG